MSDYDARMRDLEMADLARRSASADDLIALAEAYYNAPDSYHVSRGISGEPSEKNRVHRAHDTEAMRKRNSRTFGVAAAIDSDGRLDTRAGANTVRVISTDGTVSTRDVRDFRAASVHKKQRAHVTAPATRAQRDIARMSEMGTIHTQD